MPRVASDADRFGAANIIVGKIERDVDIGGECTAADCSVENVSDWGVEQREG
jgi:hypothetical protein